MIPSTVACRTECTSYVSTIVSGPSSMPGSSLTLISGCAILQARKRSTASRPSAGKHLRARNRLTNPFRAPQSLRPPNRLVSPQQV